MSHFSPDGPDLNTTTIQSDTATERQQLEHEAATALSTSRVYSSSEEAERYREHNFHVLASIVLPRYSSATMHRLIAAAPVLETNLRQLLLMERVHEDYLNDWVTVELTALTEVMDTDPIIRGLHRYENLTPQRDGAYPARRIEQVSALTRVTAHLLDLGHGIEHDVNDEEFNIHYIADPKLRNLLTTHENPAAVADLIIQRDITDADQIIILLDTMNATANAINDGAL
jgi:hypothetical protein